MTRCSPPVFPLLLLVVAAVCLRSHSGAAETAAPTPLTDIRSEPLRQASPRTNGYLFRSLLAAETGIDFVHRWTQAPRYERLLNSSMVGGGVAAGDYDGDGRVDLCLTRPAGGHRLYRNLGGCRFTNVTDQAGVRDDSFWSTGVTFADVNHDGRLDLYVCCYEGPNRLYINQGNGTFVEQAKACGLDYRGASVMMAFSDYDRDGHLDGYLLTAGLIPGPAQRFRVKFVNERPVVPEELQEYWQLFYLPEERAVAAEAGQLDHLYRNRGDGTFVDVSRQAGISGCDIGNAVLWWDYNSDGWPDLYVANDYFGPDRLYRNERNGTFTNITDQALPHTPWTSMGADIGDLNNDGLIDLITSDMSGTTRFKRMIDMIDYQNSGWFLDWAEPRQYMRNAVFYNSGTGRFLEAAYLTGLADTDWTWSILLADLDNDGRLDVFVPNGMTRDWMDSDLAAQAKGLPPDQFASFWRAQPIRADLNLAYQNQGDLRFENVSRGWGLDVPGPSFGAVATDLDNDGDLDLVVNCFEAPARVHRNDSAGQHRVTVRLEGRTGNRFGIGATARLESPSGSQMRTITLSRGFMASGDPSAHFGLGKDDRIRQLTVEWPSGKMSLFRDLAVDRAYTVSEPFATPVSTPPPRAGTLFRPSELLRGTAHTDSPFDDWALQPLLPWKLSLAGPGLAWGDVDGNGHPDLYVTGSPSKPGALYLNHGKGQFHPGPSLPPPPGEEMAPLFFDANGDGFLDLLVVRGAVRSEPGEAQLRHHLCLNDGSGRFTAAPDDILPATSSSGSVAVAADFDRDGTTDLFIGGRTIPGKYPLTPSSCLLRNQNGKFVDVTDSMAPALMKAGMVTSAIWSDTDDDGWLDLLVTCEWGPVRLFQNQRGRFVERTREAGLAERPGWWNGIAGGDIDSDGDIDYVVTNLGLNSRYQPSPDEPCQLYYGDFAGTGEPQIIEAHATRSGVFPIRGMGAFERAFPRLRERFPTHHLYARATLADIFGAPALNAALKLQVSYAQSSVLRNQGRGTFTLEPLPRLAQIAPSQGVALADVNADGNLDVLLAQNFFGPQRETGRMDGGTTMVLLGDGEGRFQPVWPNQSGVMVPGDARSLTTTDLNGDGRVDSVVGVNNGPLQAFENAGGVTNRVLSLSLRGRRGNPSALGARVIVHLGSGRTRVAEVYGGSGYLSQSDPSLTFGLGTRETVREVEVRWPGGGFSTHKVSPEDGPAVLEEQ